jgi:alpha/beta superfamily hydrolase
MYGVFHPAEGASSGAAVLMCNPFGQEAIRTHRIYRVLAEQLAKGGLAVLRFDYFGTGDSGGEDEDGDLDGWVEDVVVAHLELLRRSRASRSIWMGARLGATLASLAVAKNAIPSPAGLLLWEPIVNGTGYLTEITGAVSMTLPREAVGFSISPTLAHQLRELRPEKFDTAHPPVATILTGAKSSAIQELARRWAQRGTRLTAAQLEHRFEWTSDEAMNTSIVPPHVVQRLASEVEVMRA